MEPGDIERLSSAEIGEMLGHWREAYEDPHRPPNECANIEPFISKARQCLQIREQVRDLWG